MAAPKKKKGGMPRVMRMESMAREAAGKPQKITTKLSKGPMFPKDAVAGKPKGVMSKMKLPTARVDKPPKAMTMKGAKMTKAPMPPKSRKGK